MTNLGKIVKGRPFSRVDIFAKTEMRGRNQLGEDLRAEEIAIQSLQGVFPRNRTKTSMAGAQLERENVARGSERGGQGASRNHWRVLKRRVTTSDFHLLKVTLAALWRTDCRVPRLGAGSLVRRRLQNPGKRRCWLRLRGYQ